MKEDKIFNNRYNTGDIEFEQFPKMRIDSPDNFDILEEYTCAKSFFEPVGLTVA